MAAPKGNKNGLGNKGGGNYAKHNLQHFWDQLDNHALPHALKFCQETIDIVEKEHRTDAAWRNLGISASKVLFSKAPERIADNEGGKLATPTIYLPGQKD